MFWSGWFHKKPAYEEVFLVYRKNLDTDSSQPVICFRNSQAAYDHAGLLATRITAQFRATVFYRVMRVRIV